MTNGTPVLHRMKLTLRNALLLLIPLIAASVLLHLAREQPRWVPAGILVLAYFPLMASWLSRSDPS